MKSLAASLLAILCALAHAEPAATLSWSPPQTMADGSEPARLSGFRIYWGTSPGYYFGRVFVPGAGTTSAALSGLPTGTIYFTVTAVSDTGIDSEFSTMVSKTIATPPAVLTRPVALGIQ